MRPTDRLFQLIQILRSRKRPATAAQLAAELETSVRTVYRDIADLMAQRVPIRGEAGIGYVLEEGYDLPPLMLSATELEAAVLGARWLATQGDASLARGARDLLAKLEAVIPPHLQPILADLTMMVAAQEPAPADSVDVARVREWIRQQKCIRIRYQDQAQRVSERTLWPIAVAYFQHTRLLVGWCELRQAFRHFRTDRILQVAFLEQHFAEPVLRLQQRWQDQEQLQKQNQQQNQQ
ncbi:helix-turn-helix transcriptional regulator [Ketobacter sp.]|uniref:helix-turn-helix transcriptional regulator n=1 Tax=Ketobacter sp. TaxID=2083498 RepID=UPI000F0F15B6|nr:YafY family protein [Ketobacter sp.]RLT99277.1 MAG: YafY family transcriptional regulator [Ketobacter sp.]